jgi:hypothetical protein
LVNRSLYTNELVNTVSIVPTIELDQNKENIYPLVNIDFINKKRGAGYYNNVQNNGYSAARYATYQNKQQVTK